jgi:hypothetical protein
VGFLENGSLKAHFKDLGRLLLLQHLQQVAGRL